MSVRQRPRPQGPQQQQPNAKESPPTTHPPTALASVTRTNPPLAPTRTRPWAPAPGGPHRRFRRDPAEGAGSDGQRTPTETQQAGAHYGTPACEARRSAADGLLGAEARETYLLGAEARETYLQGAEARETAS
jgi:uncharacterized protein involved in copper resistance